VLPEPSRVDAPPAWRVVLVGAAVARRVRHKVRLNLDVLDRLALGAGDVVLGIDLAKRGYVSRRSAVVVLDCVSSAKRISSDEISYPHPATRLTPGKQSAADLTESVTIMAPAESAPAAAPPGGRPVLSSLSAPAEIAPAAAPPGEPRLLSSLPAKNAPAAVSPGGRPVVREKPPGFWSWLALSDT